MSAVFRTLWLSFVLVAFGCVAAPGEGPLVEIHGGQSAKADGPARSLRAVSHFIYTPLFRQQTESTCGVAALQSVLHYYGDEDTQEPDVAAALGTDESGTRHWAIREYAESLGYQARAATGMTVPELAAHIDAGRPVIVLIQAWADGRVDWKNTWENGHYVVATGYDEGNIYFMDPSMRGSYAYIPVAEFLDRWHDADGEGELEHFGLVIEKAGPRFDFDRALALP